MARTSLLAALAGAVLLAGCADIDRSRDRTYVSDGYGYGRAYPGGYYGRPYGYPRQSGYYDNDRYRGRSSNGRFDREGKDVVCDRRTEVCYKDGDIDASETRERFGKQPARKVERVRDRYDDNDLFLPRRNVVCNDENNTCYRNGKPNRQLSREYFGRRGFQRRIED
jgi:hypothetical protein